MVIILNEGLLNTYKDASKVMNHAVYHKTPIKTLARSVATIGGALAGRWAGRQLVSRRAGESDEDFKARRRTAGNIGLLAGASLGYSRRRYKEGQATVAADNAKLNLHNTGTKINNAIHNTGNKISNAMHGMSNNVSRSVPL